MSIEGSAWSQTKTLGFRYTRRRLYEVLDGMNELFGPVTAVQFASRLQDFYMARLAESLMDPDSTYDGDRLAHVSDWVGNWIMKHQNEMRDEMAELLA